MVENKPVGSALAKGAGRLAVHVLALVAGMVLMVVGLGMGVSVVMLPVGIPVGLFGVLLFLWGLSGHPEQQSPVPPA
jgi:hypothetical protein